ncbi:hypothetical protein K443DRAFT_678469 [Laccaria amethystina LaAM-08-1]|uniref:Uncharacterized protein n=1 Tax=Laccaria amethystina LaAM-08-1 TaxID=1095629 RepID=A0A0C9XZW1_9AGAR|nr:hypothetical protein K443DRAFT_678469 [Laccaria amethystina LaAM-08-1]
MNAFGLLDQRFNVEQEILLWHMIAAYTGKPRRGTTFGIPCRLFRNECFRARDLASLAVTILRKYGLNRKPVSNHAKAITCLKEFTIPGCWSRYCGANHGPTATGGCNRPIPFP